MNGQPSHPAQQGRPTGDRLPMMLSVVKTYVEVPPVVDQRDQIGHQSAGSQLLRREAVPTPLVFELIVDVLRIGSFPIKTRQGDRWISFGIQRGHQDCHSPSPRRQDAFPLRRSGQSGLLIIAPPASLLPCGSHRWPLADQHHATGQTPTAQAQRRFEHFPSLAGIFPSRSGTLHLGDERFDFVCMAQLEQARQSAPLSLLQKHLISVAAVATQNRGPMRARQLHRAVAISPAGHGALRAPCPRALPRPDRAAYWP